MSLLTNTGVGIIERIKTLVEEGFDSNKLGDLYSKQNQRVDSQNLQAYTQLKDLVDVVIQRNCHLIPIELENRICFLTSNEAASWAQITGHNVELDQFTWNDLIGIQKKLEEAIQNIQSQETDPIIQIILDGIVKIEGLNDSRTYSHNEAVIAITEKRVYIQYDHALKYKDIYHELTKYDAFDGILFIPVL